MESRANLTEQLAAVKAFIASPAHSSYLATQRVDLLGVEQSILATPPDSIETIAFSLKLFGRREELLRSSNFFVEAQAILEDQLAKLDEPDTNVPDNNES